MPYFEKKPVIIKAVQFTGQKSMDEILDLAAENNTIKWNNDTLIIQTLEGKMRADYGDWIIKGVKGEVYPCKPDIFALTYKLVEHYDFPANTPVCFLDNKEKS